MGEFWGQQRPWWADHKVHSQSKETEGALVTMGRQGFQHGMTLILFSFRCSEENGLWDGKGGSRVWLGTHVRTI